MRILSIVSSIIIIIVSKIILFGCQADSIQKEIVRPLKSGDLFPNIEMATPNPPEERAYLGLRDADTFTILEVHADLVYIEILNAHCFSCRKQAKSNNHLFRLIANNSNTNERIKLIGIAVGNSVDEVKQFKERYQITYPIIADPDFKIHRAVGYTKTPYSFYIRKNPDGSGQILETHIGAFLDYEELFSKFSSFLAKDMSTLPTAKPIDEGGLTTQASQVNRSMTENALRSTLESVGGSLEQLVEIQAPTRGKVYAGRLKKGAQIQSLFAVSEYRIVPCDVCQDAQFIYIFDKAGKIVFFESVHLSKYDNLPWDESDLTLIQSRLLGKYIFNPIPFDTEVDAISSATITSKVVYDSFSDGQKIYNLLKKKGFL